MIAHEKCECWNGCDDALKECIKKNKHVERVRRELMKKKLNQRLEDITGSFN